jgi:hypothetical protein
MDSNVPSGYLPESTLWVWVRYMGCFRSGWWMMWALDIGAMQ